MSESDSGFANQEWFEQSYTDFKGSKKEEERQNAEHSGTRAWLESELESRSVEAEVFDRTFEFLPIGTMTVVDILERSATLEDGEDVEAAPKLFRDICQILGEHCTDPEMDAEAFGMLPGKELQQVFESVGVSDMEEEELDRIENFRGE